MINRTLIRTRVLQVAYAHLHRGELKLTTAEQDLSLSLNRTYDLYLYFLQLIPSLTEFYREVLEVRKRKHLATQTERKPNLRLIENKLAGQLADSPKLASWYEGFSLRWEEDPELLRHLLLLIEHSSLYQDYLQLEDATYEDDRALWLNIFQQLFAEDERLAETLEELSIYWQNDLKGIERAEVEERPKTEEEPLLEALEQARLQGLYQHAKLDNGPVEIVKDFVEKTLRRADESRPIDDIILPIFKDEEDERFARMLFRQTLLKYDEQMKLTETVLSSGWSSERLADMDALLINLALTEFLYFPTIPTLITINEYIELAKRFSTSHSSSFVNGILDALAKKLREEGKILKE